MIKVTMLVPTNHNDGTPVQDSYLDTITRWFVNHFGGVTINSDLRGGYRMSDGRIAEDGLAAYSVVCQSEELSAIKCLAEKIAIGLTQERIYLEWDEVYMELVKPGD